MERMFRQAWWVRVAVVLAMLQVVFAVGIGADSEASSGDRIVIFSVWLGGAAVAIAGAMQRPQNQRRGDVLIALGVVPSVITGIIAYWFPPMWLIAAAGLFVIWSAVRDAKTTSRVLS